jgi:hypothetical protein
VREGTVSFGQQWYGEGSLFLLDGEGVFQLFHPRLKIVEALFLLCQEEVAGGA